MSGNTSDANGVTDADETGAPTVPCRDSSRFVFGNGTVVAARVRPIARRTMFDLVAWQLHFYQPMQTYLIEYKSGPPHSSQMGPAPAVFHELNQRLLRRRVHVFRKLRLGTRYHVLEVVEGDPGSVRKYADTVEELFPGLVQVRRADPIDAYTPSRGVAPTKLGPRSDRVDRAGMDSFPASDPPSWSGGHS